MGTTLGVLFIAAAAATGIYVGTRPTVMDGGWIAGKLTENLGEEGEQGLAIECDRAIPVGVTGAEFGCVFSRLGARQRIWYRMTRDGTLEQTRTGRSLDAGDAGEQGPGDD